MKKIDKRTTGLLGNKALQKRDIHDMATKFDMKMKKIITNQKSGGVKLN
jgi:hypothetical protein